MKILIVGAGPTGLTAGLELARQGIIPEIIDAKETPSPFSRAVGILPKSMEILKRSGTDIPIYKEAEKIKQILIQKDGKALIDLDISKILGNDDPFLLCLPQDRTESIMSGRLAELGVFVQYGKKVIDVKTTDNSATVSFEDKSTENYDWVIGADGVHSTVRQALGISFDGYELEEDWSIADAELKSGYDPNLIRSMLLPSTGNERDAMVIVPITNNRVRIISSTPDSLASLPIKLDILNVRRSGKFKISVRQAERYKQGRVLLAGDSAHAHSPVGGRGMNLGIDDAQEAVKAILNNDTKSYEISRKKLAKKVIDDTEFIRKVLVSKNPLTAILLKMATWFIQHVPSLQKRFVKKVLAI